MIIFFKHYKNSYVIPQFTKHPCKLPSNPQKSDHIPSFLSTTLWDLIKQAHFQIQTFSISISNISPNNIKNDYIGWQQNLISKSIISISSTILSSYSSHGFKYIHTSDQETAICIRVVNFVICLNVTIWYFITRHFW